MELKDSRPEEIVLSNWVYKYFVARELNKIVNGEEVDKIIRVLWRIWLRWGYGAFKMNRFFVLP